MATRNHYNTLTADGVTDDFWHHQSVCYLSIGHETATDMGGGDLLIQKKCEDNTNWHTVRTITAAQFAAFTNNTIAVELPPNSTVRCKLENSGSPNLYLEYTSPNRVRVG